jgi:hypothetical protein
LLTLITSSVQDERIIDNVMTSKMTSENNFFIIM